MKVCRLFWFDLCRGITYHRFYCLAVPLFLIGGFMFSTQIMGNCAIEYPGITASLGDVMLYSFAGKEIPEAAGSGKDFQLPMLWIALLLGSSLSVLGYAEYFTPYGQQVFLRSSKRYMWWLSKCVWNMITTALYFSIGILTLSLFVLLKGWKLTLTNTEEVFGYIFPGSGKLWTNSSVPVVQLLLLVFTGCAAWNLFQMYLAMYAKSYISLLSTVFMLLFSVYVSSGFLPGNYMMLMRNRDIIGMGSADSKSGYILSLFLTAVSILGGIAKIRRSDYLVEEE